MAIAAADVKKLRDLTGAGMMECKRALEESDGDFDKAVEILRITRSVRECIRTAGRLGEIPELVRKGREMWGCCPFHNEKSPSFKVSNERQSYKCFGCGKGGDCFKWLIEVEGLSFPESVEKLGAEAGVELPKWSPEDEEREQKKKSLYDIVELAAKFYEAQLFEAGGREARE